MQVIFIKAYIGACFLIFEKIQGESVPFFQSITHTKHPVPLTEMSKAPGAFFVLAFLSALRNHTIIHKLKIRQKTTKKRINTNMSENMVMCEMDCNKCKWRC